MTTPLFETEMEQGANWSAIVNYYGGDTFMAPIEEIDPGYPTQIRVSTHLLPTSSDTPVIISGIQGMDGLNSVNSGVQLCERVDADYFTVPLSTVGCEWVVGTGEITWHQPFPLSGYTARCVLRSKWYSGVKIAEYTTALGNAIIDTNDGSITLTNTAVETADMTFTKAYGDIEVVAAGGNVVRVARLAVTLSRETTK